MSRASGYSRRTRSSCSGVGSAPSGLPSNLRSAKLAAARYFGMRRSGRGASPAASWSSMW
ncbi:MAG: hypothetical protein ACREUO_01060 [Burkholderiales bacterium]